MAFSAEFDRYPLTGRFLAGRLRHELTDAEKTELEQLVVRTSTLEDGERLIARGDACEWSTILIDGFVLRTLDSGERRYAVSFHVPGDFVDLHWQVWHWPAFNVADVGITMGALIVLLDVFGSMRAIPGGR